MDKGHNGRDEKKKKVIERPMAIQKKTWMWIP